MRIGDWSSDVCSSDLRRPRKRRRASCRKVCLKLMSQESLSTKRQLKPSWLAECVVCNHLEQTTIRLIIVGRFWPEAAPVTWKTGGIQRMLYLASGCIQEAKGDRKGVV